MICEEIGGSAFPLAAENGSPLKRKKLKKGASLISTDEDVTELWEEVKSDALHPTSLCTNITDNFV